MSEFEENYLKSYFNKLTEEQKTELLIEFFEELQIQEFVSCPTERCLEEDPTDEPCWAHTGDPLI